MLKFGTTVISLFVATFGGATADTLAAATTYPTSNPLSSPDLPAPQSSLPDFFDLNDLDDFVTQEYGDPITTSVHEDIHRLYYQNLDSLSSDQEEMDYVLQIMKRFQVGTASFADPSLNWKNKEVLSKYTQQIIRQFTFAKTDTSSSDVPTDADTHYKSGGTLTSTFGKWTSACTSEKLTDPSGLGCWSGL
jgi:hypothetical protein